MAYAYLKSHRDRRNGKKVELTPAGTKGWQLASPMRSRRHLSYDVDYTLFASSNWSSPLESAFVDDDRRDRGRSIDVYYHRWNWAI